MFTERTGLPEFWVTSLAKILVGEQPCKLEAYLRGRFKYPKKAENEQMLAWKTRHTELLNTTRAEALNNGWKLRVEGFIRVTGETAVLTGKPDIVAQKPDCRPHVIDCKGGEPKDSDIAQVAIYCVAVPLAWKAPGMQFDGQVVYADSRIDVPTSRGEFIKPKLFALLRELGSGPKPPATPSPSNCRYCEVPLEHCPDRVTEIQEATTELF